jgi:hypothetical protein
MNNERYNQIIGEAYENYRNQVIKLCYDDHGVGITRPHTQEEFINRSKTEKKFSEKWGLQIEKRELSWVERYEIHKKYIAEDKLDLLFELADNENLSKLGVPTKLITLAYNNETIEVYE